MNKSKKIIASLAAVGALAFGGIAMAAPWHHGAEPVPNPELRGCLMAQGKLPAPVPPAMRGMPSYDAMGKILTLTAEQQPLWQAYMDAREAVRKPFKAAKVKGETPQPPADLQDRLERRAERAQVHADAIKTLANARAALVKSLSVEQKYVLEQFEGARRGMMKRHPGPQPKPAMPGWHHPYGPHHMNPNCPFVR